MSDFQSSERHTLRLRPPKRSEHALSLLVASTAAVSLSSGRDLSKLWSVALWSDNSDIPGSPITAYLRKVKVLLDLPLCCLVGSSEELERSLPWSVTASNRQTAAHPNERLLEQVCTDGWARWHADRRSVAVAIVV